MKKLTLVIGLLVAGSILFAQDSEMAKGKARVKIEQYKERLELTEDQVAELKKVREEYRPKMEAIKKDESKSKSEKMREQADVIEDREAAIAGILNEDQLAELAVIKEEAKAARMERRKARKNNRRSDG